MHSDAHTKYKVRKKDGASAYYSEMQRVLLRRVSVSINKEKYPEVIKKLDDVPSMNQYIIQLILNDISRN